MRIPGKGRASSAGKRGTGRAGPGHVEQWPLTSGTRCIKRVLFMNRAGGIESLRFKNAHHICYRSLSREDFGKEMEVGNA